MEKKTMIISGEEKTVQLPVSYSSPARQKAPIHTNTQGKRHTQWLNGDHCPDMGNLTRVPSPPGQGCSSAEGPVHGLPWGPSLHNELWICRPEGLSR